jgi:hypothetical protein
MPLFAQKETWEVWQIIYIQWDYKFNHIHYSSGLQSLRWDPYKHFSDLHIPKCPLHFKWNAHIFLCKSIMTWWFISTHSCLGTRWRWVVSITLATLHSGKEFIAPIASEWPLSHSGRWWWEAKFSMPWHELNSKHPVHSQKLLQWASMTHTTIYWHMKLNYIIASRQRLFSRSPLKN